MPEIDPEIAELIARRDFRAAAVRAEQDPGIRRGTPEALRLLRQINARLGHFEAAVAVGAALVGGDGADPDDLFRQAQLLNRCGRWSEALGCALRALKKRPHEFRYLEPAVQAGLSDPSLTDLLRDGVAAISERYELRAAGPRRGIEEMAPADVLGLMKLPFLKVFDPDHPAHTLLIERCKSVSFSLPSVPRWDGIAELSRVLADLEALIGKMTAIHPLVSRAAAAEYISARIHPLLHRDDETPVEMMAASLMTLGRKPFVFWFDALGTVLQPLLIHEETRFSAKDSAFYWIVKAYLESDFCLAIFTHFVDTNAQLARLFDSPKIAAKMVSLNPPDALGESAPPKRQAAEIKKRVTFLFASSLSPRPEGAFYRGIVDVLNAFEHLAARHDHVELVLRSPLPTGLSPRLRQLATTHPRIRWYPDRLEWAAYEAIMASADLFLLPGPVVYRNGLANALRYGMVPVVSDGLGFEDFVKDGVNGRVVAGRGMIVLEGAPEPAFTHVIAPLLGAVDRPPDQAFFDRFVGVLDELVLDHAQIARLSEAVVRESDTFTYKAEDQQIFDETMARSLDRALELLRSGQVLDLPTYQA